MKSWLKQFGGASCIAFLIAGSALAEGDVEAYIDEPMPEGVRVIHSEIDGPVFATAEGKTLYKWKSHRQRNGYSGETPGRPACYDEVSTVTAGLMSPYPAGIELPDLDSRPSCTDMWPPFYAPDDARSIGDWSVVERRDGRRQWAYYEQPIYTSVRDLEPGDVYGGTSRRFGGDSPAMREPIGPSPMVPPGFAVKTTFNGRLLTTDKNDSVYSFELDTAEEARCLGDCLRNRKPLLAPELARPKGEWSILERSPGVRQWVYRGKPLYTHTLDQHSWSLQGSDEQGWSNVYTQPAPPYPASFTEQLSLTGIVLADAEGRTIYTYRCGDDSVHQLSCEHPDDTQVYRVAMCGGSAERCQEAWPYVRAGDSEVATSRSWRVVSIDPETGRFAEPEDPQSIRVWAYRDRPVYTYGGDSRPGDTNGDATGEWRGQRNGLRGIWLRDDFLQRTL